MLRLGRKHAESRTGGVEIVGVCRELSGQGIDPVRGVSNAQLEETSR
jgi:hypothetical protein